MKHFHHCQTLPLTQHWTRQNRAGRDGEPPTIGRRAVVFAPTPTKAYWTEPSSNEATKGFAREAGASG